MTDQADAEKLFSPENNADLKSSEAVKFIAPNEGKNGISPISVDSVKTTFTGLTKEELMKYANDPFWVRIRLLLFILFWVTWLAMLLGAIIIIVVTPKCKEDPAPLWWQKSPLYILDVGKLAQNNPSETPARVTGILKNRIDYLKNLGVETLLLKNVLKSIPGAIDEVQNFTDVNEHLDSIDEFQKEVVEYAKSKGINIILSFEPNHSGKGESFIRSELNEADFRDTYVWFPNKYPSKPESPPNNWLSVYNSTAWEWNDKRQQFYLHQFKVSQPDFNFRNPTVIEYFSTVLEFWLKRGVGGFHLDKVEYLVENEVFQNETKGDQVGHTHEEYAFWSHYQTSNLKETTNIIKNWTKLVKSHSGIIGVSGGLGHEKNVVDFVTLPVELPAGFKAAELNTIVAKRSIAEKLPVWDWKCSNDNKTACFPTAIHDSLTIVSFLLPGTPVLLDDEFFVNGSKPINSSASSESQISKNYKNIKELIELRSLPAFTYGTFQSNVLSGTVFSFTRFKQGTPGHVVAWNVGKNETVVNFKASFSIIPGDVLVVLKSAHSFQDIYALNRRVSSENVVIPSMAAIVLSFVPHTE